MTTLVEAFIAGFVFVAVSLATFSAGFLVFGAYYPWQSIAIGCISFVATLLGLVDD
jgi:membrane protein implicated in regulation of membrane protease activity